MNIDKILEKAREIFVSKENFDAFEKNIERRVNLLEDSNIWITRLIIGTLVTAAITASFVFFNK